MFDLQPWPWYITGPMITLTMVALLLIGRRFGISSNLRTMCAIGGADKLSDYFQFDWKSQRWNLVFVLGTLVGGFVAKGFLLQDAPVDIHPSTAEALQAMGVQDAGSAFAPGALFGAEAWSNPVAMLALLVGGLFVGFGTRWANGCTSGHAISGLSSMQWTSLIAVIGFFIGGLAATHFLLPILLPLL